MPLPRIAITAGDPAGIGPEIACKAAADPRVTTTCVPVVFGPTSDEARRTFTPGVASADAGHAAYEVITKVVEAALRHDINAIATAPISKEALALAGYPWRGHTDLLAHLTGASRVAMLFYAESLRVVLATVHVPLAEVPSLLSIERLIDVMELASTELPSFGVARPRLALAALNPHAGEHGLMGDEEARVLEPAVAEGQARGIDVVGPLSADTVFVRALRGEFDAVVACYHDQGLIPIKLAAFGRAVNVTLGLPIIRTSVDHGTAFDIAGKGIADPSSLIEAVLLAARLAVGREAARHA